MPLALFLADLLYQFHSTDWPVLTSTFTLPSFTTAVIFIPKIDGTVALHLECQQLRAEDGRTYD